MDIRLLLVVAGWCIGWWLLWHVPRLSDELSDERLGGLANESPERSDPAGRGAVLPDVTRACSVIIPARNEASSIALLLASLVGQSIRPDEILVVDDQSDDATAAIAKTFSGVTVISGEPVPNGWTGKTWACHQGVQRAQHGILVFIDADVTVGPSGLDAALATHARRGGLVSIQPYHEMSRVYERLSALFNIIGFMGVGAGSPRRQARSRGAFGPCLITTRGDYQSVGGHAGVRAEVVEDLALARAYTATGLPVHAFAGGELMAFRMYPDGVGQLVEGWSKNIATGAASVGVVRTSLVGFWVTTLLISVQFMIELMMGRSDVSPAVSLFVYLMFAAQVAAMLRPLGNFGWLTATFYAGPLGLFVIVFVRSAYLTIVRRRVVWRGRSISTSKTARVAAAAQT